MEKFKYTKIISAILCFLLVASALPLAAGAAVQPSLIDASKKGSLTFYKYEMTDVTQATIPGNGEETTNIPSTAKPLAGVEFTATLVKNIDDVIDGEALPSVEEAKALVTAGATKYSAITESDGKISFTNMPLGIYLVQETKSPSQVRIPTPDFCVSIPMTDSTGTKWNYDVIVYPKNQTAYADVIVKKIDKTTNAVLSGAEFTLEQKIDDVWKQLEFSSKIVTGADGTVKITHLSTNAQYRLKETKAPENYILDSTIYHRFSIAADGTVSGEEVTGNTITIANEKPDIGKEVSTDKVNYYNDVTAAIGSKVNWRITVTVPSMIEKLPTFKVIDEMSDGLTFVPESVVVKSGIKTIPVTVTQNGQSIDISVNHTSDLSGETVMTVSLDTIINENAILGGDNNNNAIIEYSNVANPDKDTTADISISDPPEVHTGGYELKKVDGSGNALSGAEFKLFKSKEDAIAGNNEISFYAKDGSVISTAISDLNGIAGFYGLAYGENGKKSNEGQTSYWVVETKAPINSSTGKPYNLNKEPIQINVSSSTHSYTDSNVKVVNTIGFTLPFAGGAGTTIFFAAGIILAAAAITAYIKTNKKKKVTKEVK
ncbi:MAG: SpaH/EbpB family LPXTG-anchored major pilin [Acutalibacteraceae bacterium]